MRRFAEAMVVSAGLLLPVSAGAAEPLPSALFVGQTPAAVTDTIARGCIARGFILREKTVDVVTCQATEIPNKVDGGFRPRQGDPSKPFMTFTFTAEARGSDAVVRESTALWMLLPGRPSTNMDGKAAFRFKAQVRDFLSELGGEVIP